MAIPKQGTRKITVESVAYRWIVAPNDEPGLAIIVELEKFPGQKMIAWVEHGNIVTPNVVRKAILHAFSLGWQPEQLGQTVEFRLDDFLIRDTNNTPKLSIRNYQNFDDKAVQHLYGEDKLDNNLYDIAEFYSEPENLLVVGEIDNRIIATGILKKLSSDKAKILVILVHPNFRRHGYGQQILKHLEMQAIAMRIVTLNLHTISTQIAAQEFYLKNRFIEIIRKPWRSMERIYFEKRLR